MPAKYHRQALLRTLPATILPPPLTGSDKTAVRPVWPDNAPPLPIFRRGAKTCDTAKGLRHRKEGSVGPERIEAKRQE